MSEIISAKDYQRIAKPAKKTGKDGETSIHMAIVHYVNRVIPHNIMFHPANGEKRSKKDAVKLKRMGVRAGIPDLAMPIGCGKILWMEVKKPGGKLSKAQREMHDKLRNFGHTVAIVEGIDDVRNTFKALGIVTREA